MSPAPLRFLFDFLVLTTLYMHQETKLPIKYEKAFKNFTLYPGHFLKGFKPVLFSEGSIFDNFMHVYIDHTHPSPHHTLSLEIL